MTHEDELNPPWRKHGEKVIGEVTTDGGIHRRVTPRIVADEDIVRETCRKLGICTECKIALADPHRTTCSACRW
jgi:hypothetical protein